MSETTVREWLTVKSFHKRYPEAGGLNFIYEKARTGELLSIRLGARILIASDALDRLAQEKLMPTHEATGKAR